uniref:Uncharacterized protein n=1 Tax=Globodera rostochiensis TaxID=31243 RepID=A0A914IB45_GLORO
MDTINAIRHAIDKNGNFKELPAPNLIEALFHLNAFEIRAMRVPSLQLFDERRYRFLYNVGLAVSKSTEITSS